MRLVPLNATVVPTGPCDGVHFGGVEIFREGAWGRICTDGVRNNPEEFTLDAHVVCSQLGFPFGTAMEASEFGGVYDYSNTSSDYSDTPVIVWASRVRAVSPHRLSASPPGCHCCHDTLLTCVLKN